MTGEADSHTNPLEGVVVPSMGMESGGLEDRETRMSSRRRIQTRESVYRGLVYPGGSAEEAKAESQLQACSVMWAQL